MRGRPRARGRPPPGPAAPQAHRVLLLRQAEPLERRQLQPQLRRLRQRLRRLRLLLRVPDGGERDADALHG